jgi:hypothetical protein
MLLGNYCHQHVVFVDHCYNSKKLLFHHFLIAVEFLVFLSIVNYINYYNIFVLFKPSVVKTIISHNSDFDKF